MRRKFPCSKCSVYAVFSSLQKEKKNLYEIMMLSSAEHKGLS
jgi:hypothetical protein